MLGMLCTAIRYHSKIIFLILTMPLLVSTSLAAEQWQDNNNGTISDLATGLIWQKQDDNTQRNHAAALSYCAALRLAGNSNWRLPRVKELASIIDDRRYNPSIDSAAFPGTNLGFYWSTRTVAGDSTSAWTVNFSVAGLIGSDKTGSAFVRCVR